MLTKDQILSACETVTVEVPEWKGSVLIRMLTAKEALDFLEYCEQEKDGLTQQFKLCCLTIVDESGNRIFSDEDIDILKTKSGRAINRIIAVAMSHNGLSDVNELEKN
jgi:hypothetical protein